VAAEVMAADDFGAGGRWDPEPSGSGGDAAGGTDFDFGAFTPDERPPRTAGARWRTERFSRRGGGPRSLRSHWEGALDFLLVAVRRRSVRCAWAVSSSVLRSLAKQAGRRFRQHWCSRSALPLAWDVGAVELEIAKALGFAGREAVVGRRLGGTAFAQQGGDLRRPVRGVIAAEGAGHPEFLPVRSAGAVVGVEFVAAAAGKAGALGASGASSCWARKRARM
jgi:hypothetical protein